MKTKQAFLWLLTLSTAAFSQIARVQPGVSGSEVNFQTNGNVSLQGHCFGNVSSLPTSPAWSWYGGGAAKNGNLYFSGSITEGASSFPGQSLLKNGSSSIFSLNGGDFHLAGTCQNASGCSNTEWLSYSMWNDWNWIQYDNNCYNYGTDTRTDTYAQPGRANGFYLSSGFTTSDVQYGAQLDGLTWVGSSFPGNTYDCGSGHLVFMAVWPGYDYHWWRFDQKTGAWSHKMGWTASSNLDDSGNPIYNPLTADRGSYTDAGGFFCICGTQANIY